jgi:polyvinyl alcohol dehydrogenase (cytochrome)
VTAAAKRTAVLRRLLALTALVLALAAPAHARAIDRCDWTSFRNGPAGLGASDCTAIGVGNVGRLLPRLPHRMATAVSATPAVVDGVTYVGSWDGTFSALDADGVRWQRSIDDANGVGFGRIVDSAAVADVAGTRVVVFGGGATLYVLDAADGHVLARQCLDPRTTGRCAGSGDLDIEIESSPVVVPDGDGAASVLVGLDVHNQPGVGRTGVVRLRLADAGGWSLSPVWKFDPEADAVLTGDDLLTRGAGTGWGCGGVWGSPAVDVDHDLVAFGTASCSAGAPDGVRGEEVWAVRLGTGERVWRFTPARTSDHLDDDFGASPQLFHLGDRLVVGAGGKDGWYRALDAATGAPVWQTHVGQTGHLQEDFAIGGIIGSPAVGGGRIYVTTAISVPDPTVLEDPGRMLSLHALDAATGRVLWRQPLTRQTYGHPSYANGVVFVPSTVGLTVQAFAASTGLPLWTSPPLDAPPAGGIAVTGAGITFGTGTSEGPGSIWSFRLAA